MGKWDHLVSCDNQVLAALSVGNFRRAIDALVSGYQGIIVGFCTHMLGDPTQGEEMAQEVFLAAYQALPHFRQDASVRTWVFAIARNRCLTSREQHRRHHQRTADYSDEVVDAVHANPSVSPEVSLLEAEKATREEKQRALVSQSLRGLNKQARELLMMYYFEEFSIADMAKKHWVSETTIRRRLRAAEQQLKHSLAQLGWGHVDNDA